MITCSVCGGLNDPNNAVCEHCGSDLIDESDITMMITIMIQYLMIHPMTVLMTYTSTMTMITKIINLT